MNRRWIPFVASAAFLAACSDAPTPPVPQLAPGGALFVSAGSQSSDWEQCANGSRDDAVPCNWIPSVLNVGKATYREGELIPFRFAVHVVDIQGKKQVAPNPNTERRVTFTYGFKKATNGNYDFIGKFNQTEKVRANVCSGDFSPVVGVYCNAAPSGALAGTLRTPTYGSDASPLYSNADGVTHSVIPIDKNKFLANVPSTYQPALDAALTNYLAKGGKLEIDIFGGKAGSVDNVTYNIGGDDVTATITVRFFANQKDVLIAFGAHFARTQDWSTIGYAGGAGQSGSPFHIKVDSIDGTGAGALGNNVAGGVVVLEANLLLSKSSSVTTVNAGDQIDYSVAINNAGDGAASNVQIHDALPTNPGLDWSLSPAVNGCSISGSPGSQLLDCTFSTLAAGATTTVKVTSPTTGASCGTISNTASAAAPTTVANSPTPAVTITVNCPSLSLAKTTTTPTVTAGGGIKYTVTVSNAGPGTAYGVTISDNLPSAGTDWAITTQSGGGNCLVNGQAGAQTLSCGPASVAAGGAISVIVASLTTTASCPSLSNTADASATNGTVDKTAAGPIAITVSCPPKLEISKVAASASIQEGDQAKYTITVKNTGLGSATNVVVTDNLQAISNATWAENSNDCSIASNVLTCSGGALASLAAGASFSVDVTVTIPAGFTQNPVEATGTINIDGDLTVPPNSTELDWVNDGVNCATNTGCKLDKATGTSDDSFGQGTKEDTSVPTVTLGSIPNNKSDLLRFYVSSNHFNGNDYLYLGWVRVQAPKGTTNMDFELNQSTETSSNNATPKRLAGDILVKYDLDQGGTTPTIGYHKWVTSVSAQQLGLGTPSQACEASSSFPCWGKVTILENGVPTDKAAGAVNTIQVTDPLSGNQSLDPYTFGEASINLQKAGVFDANVCVAFGRAYLKSRSSSSFTAEIKDFVAPLPVNISNCKPVEISNLATATADGGISVTTPNPVVITVSNP